MSNVIKCLKRKHTNPCLGYKLGCAESILICKKLMASNRISSIWVVLFVFVLGLLCARASSPLNVAHASGFHASNEISHSFVFSVFWIILFPFHTQIYGLMC